MPNITAEQQRICREKRRIKKQCQYCSSPAQYHNRNCEKHREVRKKLDRRKRQNREAQGKCVRCAQLLDIDADVGRLNCINCREGSIKPRLLRLRVRD